MVTSSSDSSSFIANPTLSYNLLPWLNAQTIKLAGLGYQNRNLEFQTVSTQNGEFVSSRNSCVDERARLGEAGANKRRIGTNCNRIFGPWRRPREKVYGIRRRAGYWRCGKAVAIHRNTGINRDGLWQPRLESPWSKALWRPWWPILYHNILRRWSLDGYTPAWSDVRTFAGL